MADRDLPPSLKGAVEFHGHLCPGLLIGYRAGAVALERLGVTRAEDEELVAIVENDSCSVDGIQFLTGCTFGKGNLFFRDHGKQVFTVARRPSGEGVRLALRPGVMEGKDRESLIDDFLQKKDEELFDIEMSTVNLPKEAEIHGSVICDDCGEPTMKTRTKKFGDKMLCIPCAKKRKQNE
ncbi:MAG: formylmethanofuran dehydrogenase [Planctomycetes bacterium]|nr:formylmethanofuran dehydrogenase [Planctomycetota bacterium]